MKKEEDKVYETAKGNGILNNTIVRIAQKFGAFFICLNKSTEKLFFSFKTY